MKHKRIAILMTALLMASLTSLNPQPVYAATTTAMLGGGVCINEILVDPNGAANFDTDGNGTAASTDEFIELYNAGSESVDISGWQFWDYGSDVWFTFPGDADDGTTILPAGAYALVISGVQSGGSLPSMTNPGSRAFDAGRTIGDINNTGDTVVVYDPGANEYIQVFFGGVPPADPTIRYPGSTRIGSIEDWGNFMEGISLTRYPSGDTNVILHTATPGGDNASPNSVTLLSLNASSHNIPELLFSMVLVAVCSGLLMYHRRKATT